MQIGDTLVEIVKYNVGAGGGWTRSAAVFACQQTYWKVIYRFALNFGCKAYWYESEPDFYVKDVITSASGAEVVIFGPEL